jgi:hypothetical protein
VNIILSLSGLIFPIDEPYRPPPQANNVWYHDLNSDQVIVFVHGVLSDSYGCWYREPTGDRPGAYWPDLLRNDTRFNDYSIFLGGYYTDVDAGQYEVSDCAEELFQALQRPGEHGGSAILDRKVIVFVCHSMGGIVVRYMLTARPWSFADKKISLLLIASPTFGSLWANRLDLLISYFKNTQGKQLKWGNWNLKDVDDRFQLILNEKAIAQLTGAEACENRFVLHGKWIPPVEAVVPRDSAGRYFGRVRMLPNTDHFSCVKPNNHSHPTGRAVIPDRARCDLRRVARGAGACRAAAGWQSGGSLSRALSHRPGLRRAPQSGIIPQAGAAALVPSAPFGRHTRLPAAVSPISQLTGLGRGQESTKPGPPTGWKTNNSQGTPGKNRPAIFALYVSEDRCSEASPKQINSEKPKPPERAA